MDRGTARRPALCATLVRLIPGYHRLMSRVVVLGTCTGTWSVLKYHFQVRVLVLVLGTEVLVLVLVLETWVLLLVLVLETQVPVVVLVLEWLSTGYNSADESLQNAVDSDVRCALQQSRLSEMTLLRPYLCSFWHTTETSHLLAQFYFFILCHMPRFHSGRRWLSTILQIRLTTVKIMDMNISLFINKCVS